MMKPLLVLTGVLLASAAASAKEPLPPGPKPKPCGDYGTSVHFESSPAEAAQLARKSEKLVLVLHVSGHFEDPQFT